MGNWSLKTYNEDYKDVIEHTRFENMIPWDCDERTLPFPEDANRIVGAPTHPDLEVKDAYGRVLGRTASGSDATPIMFAVDSNLGLVRQNKRYAKNRFKTVKKDLKRRLKVVKRLRKGLQPFMYIMQKCHIVPDPTMAVALYGLADYIEDPVLQVTRFSDDNRFDLDVARLAMPRYDPEEDLSSTDLAAYYIAHHVQTDAYDVNRNKGYLFFITDTPSDELEAQDVIDFLGVEKPKSVDPKYIYRYLRRRWNVFFIVLDNEKSDRSSVSEQCLSVGENEHVIKVPDVRNIPALAASIIGDFEGTLDLDKWGEILETPEFNTPEAKRARKSVQRAIIPPSVEE